MTGQQPRPMTPAERREFNRRTHAEQRQQRQAERGPRGIAAAWWDRARMVAAEQESNGNPAAWDDLAAFLSNYCGRYSQ
ncbi:hypothetical protein AB0L80_38705 [Streptomyces sp. NPDC052069]|uniref:hypothetical protein n=1 Tax=Streptomyces sp. NPDC052069 TaxID=3154650 RepID=UPI0034484A2C